MNTRQRHCYLWTGGHLIDSFKNFSRYPTSLCRNLNQILLLPLIIWFNKKLIPTPAAVSNYSIWPVNIFSLLSHIRFNLSNNVIFWNYFAKYSDDPPIPSSPLFEPGTALSAQKAERITKNYLLALIKQSTTSGYHDLQTLFFSLSKADVLK